jgi:hypothetical protein
MLLRTTHINSVMSLSANGVTLALHNAGYIEDVIKTASFSGMTVSGSFVYICTFFDVETRKDEDATVFVFFTDTGVMHASY